MNMQNQQKEAANVDHIINNANEEQLMVMEKWSRLVGKVLSNIEIALPEGRQYTILKRLLNDIIYGARNNLLFFFGREVENQAALDKIKEEVENMIVQIDTKLEMAFPQSNQQRAVKASVQASIEEVVSDVVIYFSEE